MGRDHHIPYTTSLTAPAELKTKLVLGGLDRDNFAKYQKIRACYERICTNCLGSTAANPGLPARQYGRQSTKTMIKAGQGKLIHVLYLPAPALPSDNDEIAEIYLWWKSEC